MAATQNYSLPLPQLGEPADIRVLDQGTEMIDGIMHGNRTMVAPAWVSTETYHTGSRVVYLGEYYKCKEDNVTGAWDATKWDKTTVGEDIEGLGTGGASELADLDDVEITSPTDGQALLYDDSDDKWKNGTLPDPSVTKTATGNPIEITDAADAPLVKCVTAITGYQEGTGTPSPDNIRPIVAYTDGEIEVSDGDGNITTHTTTYPSAIYRGSEDVVNGTETHDMVVIDLSTITEWQSITYESQRMVRCRIESINYNGATGIICSHLNRASGTTAYEVGTFRNKIGNYYNFEVCISGITNQTEMNAWLASQTSGGTPVQLVIPLQSPTTSSVTPTNLPIKSLSGYNHIESSTGDMEVEYIRNTYQPIVDLIQSSSHVYSTAEQIVGKWTDGKDVYEKTIVIQNFSASTADSGWYYGTVNLADYGINPERLFPQQGETFIVLQDTTPRIPIYIDWQGGTNLYLYFLGSRSGTLTVVVRYTKVTVSRSLNAPVTSRKAQIEPLTDKTEEVPVEEEKAVETPETEEPENER